MKLKIILSLAFVLSVGFGCANHSQHTPHSDRAHALETAFRYTFDKFSSRTRDFPEFVIVEDTEFASWLVSEFRGYKPAVLSTASGRVSPMFNNWSAKIQAIGDNHATIWVRFYQFPESGGGYILELHREKRRWIVDSEKCSQTGS